MRELYRACAPKIVYRPEEFKEREEELNRLLEKRKAGAIRLFIRLFNQPLINSWELGDWINQWRTTELWERVIGQGWRGTLAEAEAFGKHLIVYQIVQTSGQKPIWRRVAKIPIAMIRNVRLCREAGGGFQVQVNFPIRTYLAKYAKQAPST